MSKENKQLVDDPELLQLMMDDTNKASSLFKPTNFWEYYNAKIISEINTRAEAKREELVEASRKRRTMEILKERDLKQYKIKLAKMETETMDEIASNYWHLNS